jgi:hypothetical protein
MSIILAVQNEWSEHMGHIITALVSLMIGFLFGFAVAAILSVSK